jgi:hypothetical protein
MLQRVWLAGKVVSSVNCAERVCQHRAITHDGRAQVARLLPPESPGVANVAREVGISVQTLERWRADALSGPTRDRVWTAAARLKAVITTAALNDAQRSQWCPAKGGVPGGVGEVV